MIKIGLDIHGCIDTFHEKYLRLVQAFDPDSVEIHIVTGIKRELDDTPVLQFQQNENHQLHYNYWFSIHEECEKQGVHIQYDELNRPHVNPEIWNKMKAEYCERVGIDFMFDDSPVYGEYFNGETVYLHQRNVSRDDWRHKAKQ